MSRLVPREHFQSITFFSTHTTQWLDHAAQIGTSTQEVALLADEVEAARAALTAQRQAQQAARSATLRLKLAIEAMKRRGANILAQVKAKAAADGGSIYTLARISPPDDPSPIGAPGLPTGFSVELQAGGSLVLKWECPNPRGAVGTIYQVSRCIGTSGKYEVIGISGTKSFTDDTVPTGTASVTYQVIAMRSTKRGPTARHTVNLGTSGAQAASVFLPRRAPRSWSAQAA